jgi:hypothetical protein
MVIMLLIVGIFNFITCLIQNRGYEWTSPTEVSYSWITKMSFGNFGMDQTNYSNWPLWLLIALSGMAIIIIALVNICYRRF